MMLLEVIEELIIIVAGVIGVGGAYHGIRCFLDQAAKYEEEAKHYFDDK